MKCSNMWDFVNIWVISMLKRANYFDQITSQLLAYNGGTHFLPLWCHKYLFKWYIKNYIYDNELIKIWGNQTKVCLGCMQSAQ